MKPALVVTTALGAVALFAASAAILPVRGGPSAAIRRPTVQALNPQPLPPRWLPPAAPLPPGGIGIA